MTGTHLTLEELEAGLNDISAAPKDQGFVRLIVRRPQSGEREVLQEGKLDATEGLLGDNWKVRGSSRTPDGAAHPEMQLTIMNVRAIAAMARQQEHWQLAGDQLFIDLDLSLNNVPPGTKLALGTAVIEITSPPHTGCKKFSDRFGQAAMQFVNSPVGRQMQLRGVHAKVVQSGGIRVGDLVRRI